MKQVNLFAEETQLERLSKLGDSLERLKIIDFESFRPILTDGLKKERKSNAGRHPFDNVMMFKVLVLEKLFNLSDVQTEYQITDRINLCFEHNALTDGPVEQFAVYISSQVLANSITFADFSDSEDTFRLEIDGEEIRVNVTLG